MARALAIVLATVLATGTWVVSLPAMANPTAYDVSPLLQQRDAFADRFWGLLQAPQAPTPAPGSSNRLYDFAPVLRGADPFANAFWNATAPTPTARR
jgi:hypothetical protein